MIEAAKTMIALDAADGKLDLHANDLPLQTPLHTIFWSGNSAQALLVRLAEGRREIEVNGRKVQMTPAFENWVLNTMFLESAPAPGGHAHCGDSRQRS